MMMKMKNRRGNTTDGRTNSRKDVSNGGEEDLILFRDMHKRHKERIVSLLQPVSADFESNSGNYPLYRIASAKRGLGLEFAGEADKNDYDWLKTPPATPLFPSLEMEAIAPELAIRREITIIQPAPSRFAGGNSSETTKLNFRPKSPSNPKPNKVPSRSSTPSVITRPSRFVTPSTVTKPSSRSTTPSAMRPQVPSTDNIATKTIQYSNNKTSCNNNSNNVTNTKLITSNPILQTTLNPKMATAGKDSNSKPSSRGVSPLVRSRIPATIPWFSDETPPNLRTDRSSSASRGRPMNPTVTIHPKQEQPIKPSRQSCSPSMSRGRRSMESNQENTLEGDKTRILKGKSSHNVGNSGSLAFGSKMVEKVMNARKSSVSVVDEEKETIRIKARASSTHNNNESSGFGRMMSKSSLDMALRHMEIRRDPNDFRQSQPTKNAMVAGLKPNLESSNRTSQVQQASWRRKEPRRFHSKE